MTTPHLFGDLKRDEGLRLLAYPDPLTGGAPFTIGWGHAGPDVHPGLTWNLAQAESALANDVTMARNGLDAHLPWWRKLDDVRQDVLVAMAFNMGLATLQTFHHTLNYIEAGEWELAAEGMLASLWAKQVKGRARRLAEQMRTGVHA